MTYDKNHNSKCIVNGNFRLLKNCYYLNTLNDIFDILNIKCPEFENKYKKVEYDHYDHADDPIFMDKLKKSLNIK